MRTDHPRNHPIHKPFLAAVLAAGVTVAGIAAAPVTGAAVAAAHFTGTVSEIVDPAAQTDTPRRSMRHVGNPAPAGYAHDYQWGAPAITTPPGAEVITFTGTIDVTDAVAGDSGFIGLYDTATLAAGHEGDHGYGDGVYFATSKWDNGTVSFGVGDGYRLTLTSLTYDSQAVAANPIFDVVFTIDSTADPMTECLDDSVKWSMYQADGCATLTVRYNDYDATVTYPYGISTRSDYNDGIAFRDGGTAGWDGSASAQATTGIHYDLMVSPVTAPATKDDCKDGAWVYYGYDNQGRCVSDLTSNN